MLLLLANGLLPNLTVASARNEAKFVSGEVILGFEEISVSSLDAIRANGGIIKGEIPQLKALVVKVDAGKEDEFIKTAKALPGVKYAERNGIVQAAYIPNDPNWNLLWNMPKIKADKAWDTYRGYKTVIIAIIDTGVDYTHSDLAVNYMPGGYDWVNDDFDPMDDNSHGTHCAGIAAAVMDNSIGVVGVAQSKIWAEKVLNSAGSGSWDDIANAIIHATDKQVNIISMSLGGYSYSSLLESACTYAYNKNVLLVAAAGNDNTNLNTNPFYPACFNTVIAVGATTSTDAKSSYSNYGDQVELSAPGDNIYSTVLSNSYGYKTGTSMATPHVAGLAALIWSYKPTQSNGELRSSLQKAVDDLGTPGRDIYFGYGRINCQKQVSSPEKYQYRFTLSPFIDRAWVNITSQSGGTLIYGKLNVTSIHPSYPAPILGWASGDDFYMTFDYRTAGPGYYELGFLVGKISTRSGKLYRTTDGQTWVGPTSVTLNPFTTETSEESFGPCTAEVIEPQAIQYVEGFNTGGTPTTWSYIGGWYGIPYTPSITYPLKKVELMAGGGTGTFIVQLRTDSGGYPSSTILRHVAFTMSNTRTWQGAEFDTAYKVTAGVQYWIVFQPVAGSYCSFATSGTLITHVWDDLADGTGDWDFKDAVYPWMAKFYREVQPTYSYRFNLSPFSDKVYVNVASQTGGSLIYGLANTTTTTYPAYPAPVLGWASGDNFYMAFDYRTTLGASIYELGFIVGKISTRSGKLYRTRFGPDWYGPASVTLVPFAQEIESIMQSANANN